MSLRYLGESIDVHGGGTDLIYPHHESEIAQSELFTGATPFARFWVHTGMVRLNGQKMSKSLGNLILVRDLLREHSAAAVRLYLLDHPYRYGWDFEAGELGRYEEIADRISRLAVAPSDSGTGDAFFAALDDDLDTPQALRQLEAALQRAEAGQDEAEVALATYRRVLGV